MKRGRHTCDGEEVAGGAAFFGLPRLLRKGPKDQVQLLFSLSPLASLGSPPLEQQNVSLPCLVSDRNVAIITFPIHVTKVATQMLSGHSPRFIIFASQHTFPVINRTDDMDGTPSAVQQPGLLLCHANVPRRVLAATLSQGLQYLNVAIIVKLSTTRSLGKQHPEAQHRHGGASSLH